MISNKSDDKDYSIFINNEQVVDDKKLKSEEKPKT